MKKPMPKTKNTVETSRVNVVHYTYLLGGRYGSGV
jgi:hypothetical protein